MINRLWSNFAARVNLKLLIPGLLCLLLLAEINGALLHQLLQGWSFDPDHRWTANIHVQMALSVRKAFIKQKIGTFRPDFLFL